MDEINPPLVEQTLKYVYSKLDLAYDRVNDPNLTGEMKKLVFDLYDSDNALGDFLWSYDIFCWNDEIVNEFIVKGLEDLTAEEQLEVLNMLLEVVKDIKKPHLKLKKALQNE